MKNLDCTVVGDAMVDILLPLSGIDDFYCLSQGGVCNTRMQLTPGGSANVAFYISRLGGKAVFMGMVGDDYFGQVFQEDLKKNGIQASVSVSKGKNTGLVFVLVFPGGERFFIDDRGANARLSYEDLDLDMIRQSRYLFFGGYSFQDEQFPDIIKRLLGGVAGDTGIVFNPGAPNLAKDFRSSFTDVIKKYVDILILNESEARYLTGYDSEKEMVDCLLSFADTVALTRGSRGSIIGGQGQIHEIKASPARVVDTTGAGDAYAAGFIYGLCQGWNVKAAGELASRVAGEVVTCLGARVKLSNLPL